MRVCGHERHCRSCSKGTQRALEQCWQTVLTNLNESAIAGITSFETLKAALSHCDGPLRCSLEHTHSLWLASGRAHPLSSAGCWACRPSQRPGALITGMSLQGTHKSILHNMLVGHPGCKCDTQTRLLPVACWARSWSLLADLLGIFCVISMKRMEPQTARLPKLQCRGMRSLPPSTWLVLIGVSVALVAQEPRSRVFFGAVPICVLTIASTHLAWHSKVKTL